MLHPIAALVDQNIKSLAEVIVQGMLVFIGLDSICPFFSRIANIILASLIKLTTDTPYMILPHLLSLITYLLKLCAFCDDEGDVPLHIMGIHCLISITNFTSARKVCKDLISMVTSNLASAVYHLYHTV